MQIPVAVVTDADPAAPDQFPAAEDALKLSAAATAISKAEDAYVKCFFAQKTLEYDLALDATRRGLMVEALTEIHQRLVPTLRSLSMALLQIRRRPNCSSRACSSRKAKPT